MKTLTLSRILCVALASTILSFSAHAADAAQKLHLRNGDKFTYKVTTENVNTTTMMGNENVSNLNADMTGIVSVTKQNADSVVFGIALKDATLGVKGMNFFGIPDTTVKKNDLDGASETVVTSLNGKVLRRESKAASANPGAGGEQMIMRQLVGNRSPLRGLFMTFPDKPLVKGDEWTVATVDTADQGMGKVITSISLRYTFDSFLDTLGKKCGKVRLKSEKFVISGTLRQMGQELNMDGDGVVNGVYIFEVANGMPVVMTNHTQIDQRITIGDGMEIPTSIDIKSTIKRQQ